MKLLNEEESDYPDGRKLWSVVNPIVLFLSCPEKGSCILRLPSCACGPVSSRQTEDWYIGCLRDITHRSHAVM